MDRKATIFEFSSYEFKPDQKRVFFHYKTSFDGGAHSTSSGQETINWTETIMLPEIPETNHLPKELLEKLLQSLHLIIGISYWKFHGAPEIKTPYQLSKTETGFWNTVYHKGLGEFFYRNNLNPKLSPKFPTTSSLLAKTYNLKPSRDYLVGIGGGKDSIVSAELLKTMNADSTAFVVETGKESPLIDNVIKAAGLQSFKISRQLDEKAYQQHQHNGHVPISAIYAFLATFCSALYGYKGFIVSNEYSSNFGSIKYKGLEINHQWSKSFEFEQLFQDYLKNVLSPDLQYFSLLRPFYEIRIVKMFAGHKKYFPLFSSCNNNFKANKVGEGLWCGQCPKCVFAFTLLSAFLSKKELIGIFGQNLYQNEALLPLFKDVLGFGTMKPFDCVGTFEESETALFMAKKKFGNDFIVKTLGKRAKFHPEVFKTNKNSAAPEQFKFLGMETAIITGQGIESKSIQQYLKQYYPKLKRSIGDASKKTFLKEQQHFDIGIKTPGIHKSVFQIPYTTATNIFFSNIKGKNTIIGVTGSKGKSTTSSLIYSILKEAGKDVQLLGNIGTPMLEALTNSKLLTPNSYFVLELSSYQLDDLKFSPDISVVTSLFPEHMDFHGGIKPYFGAKQNIINFHREDNFFVYNQHDKEIKKWLKNYQGKAVPFSTETFESNLIGEHNQQNIRAASAVAAVLGISDVVIRQAVKNFKALPHRLERVGEFKGITFYNDANAATPEAAIMAIKALKNVGTIFLGGEDRGYKFTELEKTVRTFNIKNIVLFPDTGKRMIKHRKGLNILETKNMNEAVKFAYQYTEPGKICLLSCGSPSYSLWKNFEEKGNQFKEAVIKLSR